MPLSEERSLTLLPLPLNHWSTVQLHVETLPGTPEDANNHAPISLLLSEWARVGFLMHDFTTKLFVHCTIPPSTHKT
jgi:hypothetical protein